MAAGMEVLASAGEFARLGVQRPVGYPSKRTAVGRISMNTRKPVSQLTADDFVAFPVWEYASDEEGQEDRDETWVRPVGASIVPKRSCTHVAADFTAACGKQFGGFVTVSMLEGPPEVSQGSVLHERESLFISNPGAFGFGASRARLLSVLRLTEAEMFPLSFRLRVQVAGHEQFTGGMLP
ncbi:MAG TPA: hypothetical protein VK762_34105 [Polyangiaceae bacterium]|nr:hypothetical protein [Polyangiaceae bacterium]